MSLFQGFVRAGSKCYRVQNDVGDNMKRFLLSFVLTFALSQTVLGQALIEGTVKEAGSGKAISGVNVYLAGTTFGASTDQGGYYKISTEAKGPYQLVFSFVGYQKKVYRIELTSSFSQTINVNLKEQVEELEEVEVRASNKKWKEQYEIFFDQFIGQDMYAEKVAIQNPWVINFEENGRYLIATAQRPIKIINKALGYKLHCELAAFKWSKYRNQDGYYKLYTRYESLDTSSDGEKHRWKRNRVKVYMGSFNHFLKKLYHNAIEESGFTIDENWNLDPLSKGKTKSELMSFTHITHQQRQNAKGFELKAYTDIEYNGSVKYDHNGETHSLSIKKDSGISPGSKNRYFFVDEYGSLLNPISVSLYGNWAGNRMASSLPANYSVGD